MRADEIRALPAGRELVIRIVVALGPLVMDRDPAKGTTFTGYSPQRIGQAVGVEIMQALKRGERILSFDVNCEELPSD